ncbi:uncharacterized protein [Euwallacea fornicatus]|uniref:uncharacterized protein n=1 Tax=Euwallacea fornicatus TaxID=995702 RepID=UPI00338EF251
MWFIIVLLWNMSIILSRDCFGNLQTDIEERLNNGNRTYLSRKRRYLVFPKGSSFQLVDGRGFFVYGNTAGMAWELPSTPVFLDKKYMKKEEPQTTTTMLPHLDHPVEYGHDDWQVPSIWDNGVSGDFPGWKSKADEGPVYSWNYDTKLHSFNNYRRPVNVDSLKGSAYNQPTSNGYQGPHQQKYWPKYHNENFWNNVNNRQRSKKTGYSSQKLQRSNDVARNFIIDTQHYHNIHRRTRRELYAKFEDFFTTFTTNGRTCLLKTICQINKSSEKKGTFWEELLKIVFKVKPEGFYKDEDLYDSAANSSHNCEEMYSECEGNVLNKLIRFDFDK